MTQGIKQILAWNVAQYLLVTYYLLYYVDLQWSMLKGKQGRWETISAKNGRNSDSAMAN